MDESSTDDSLADDSSTDDSSTDDSLADDSSSIDSAGLFGLFHQYDQDDTSVVLYCGDFQNQSQVDAAARSLRRRNNGFSVDLRIYFDAENNTAGDPPLLDWQPLLQELESLDKVKSVEIISTPSENLRHLFHSQGFFQALRRNANAIKIITLFNVDFSSTPTEGITSFLENAPSSLTDLHFRSCNAGPGVATSVFAEAILRNIQVLSLKGCDFALSTPILQRLLASTDSSALPLESLEFFPESSFPSDTNNDSEQTSDQAVGQYLASSNATSLQRLILHDVYFEQPWGFCATAHGLNRNNSVKDLALVSCWIGPPQFKEQDVVELDEGNIDADDAATAQELGKLLRNKQHLTTLHISGGDILHFPSVYAAVGEMLVSKNFLCSAWTLISNVLI